MDEQLSKLLNDIDAKIEGLTKEKGVSEQALKAEIDKLGAEQLKLAKALQDAEQKSIGSVPQEGESQSIGSAFVKSKSFNDFGSNRKAVFTFNKAASTTAASNTLTLANVVTPEYKPGIVAAPDLPLVIENLFPHVPTQSNSVNYIKEGAMTNNAAKVAEAGSKPETTFTAPTLANANVATVAHWTRITNQLAADAPALQAYINQKMIYGLQAKVDAQLVTGDGSATQLDGLLNAGNFVDPVTAGTIVPADFDSNSTLIDFVGRVGLALEATAINPQVLILNPKNWGAITFLKDKQNRYLLSGPQARAGRSLWDIPVVTSASMTQDKYVLGNLTLGATIYDRQAIEVAMSDSDNQNFTQNLITIRVERRLAVAYEIPRAIFGGDFVIPSV